MLDPGFQTKLGDLAHEGPQVLVIDRPSYPQSGSVFPRGSMSIHKEPQGLQHRSQVTPSVERPYAGNGQSREGVVIPRREEFPIHAVWKPYERGVGVPGLHGSRELPRGTKHGARPRHDETLQPAKQRAPYST